MEMSGVWTQKITFLLLLLFFFFLLLMAQLIGWTGDLYGHRPASNGWESGLNTAGSPGENECPVMSGSFPVSLMVNQNR